MKKIKIDTGVLLNRVYDSLPPFDERKDKRAFKEEYTTKSLEQQCEDGNITGEQYDMHRIKKDLEVRGVI